MKVRSGFVSNSSSSSFIALAIPMTAWVPQVNHEEVLKEMCSLKEIDQLAMEYFDEDDMYEAFRKGAKYPDFWAWAYKKRVDHDKLPEDYYTMTHDDVEYLYRQVGPAVEYGSAEVNMNDINVTTQRIQKDFPGAPIKMFVRHCE